MSVRTLPKPARRSAWLTERVAMDGPALKVDRNAGVIYGVKVCGRNSPNAHGQTGARRTEYTEAALKESLSRYEGVNVMANHPERSRAGAERAVSDTIGVLRNCRLESDGVRADLHYSRVHPMAAEIVEDVERRLGRFGLSHNARGEGQVRNGVYVIESIPQVRSVDLVTRPATNRNLWESRDMAGTLRTLLESALPKLSESRQKWVTWLLEMDGMGDLPAPAAMDAEPEAPDPDEALKAAVESAGTALWQSMIAGETDEKTGLGKMKDLLKFHSKTGASNDPEPPGDDDESDDDDKPKKQKGDDMKESIELTRLKAKDAARDLCESLDFVPSKDQLEALTEIATPTARKAAAEAFKAAKGAAARPNNRPISRPPGSGSLLESRNGEPAVTDVKGFTARLFS